MGSIPDRLLHTVQVVLLLAYFSHLRIPSHPFYTSSFNSQLINNSPQNKNHKLYQPVKYSRDCGNGPLTVQKSVILLQIITFNICKSRHHTPLIFLLQEATIWSSSTLYAKNSYFHLQTDCVLLGEEFAETGPFLPLSSFQVVGKGPGFNIYAVTLTLRNSNCYITMFFLFLSGVCACGQRTASGVVWNSVAICLILSQCLSVWSLLTRLDWKDSDPSISVLSPFQYRDCKFTPYLIVSTFKLRVLGSNLDLSCEADLNSCLLLNLSSRGLMTHRDSFRTDKLQNRPSNARAACLLHNDICRLLHRGKLGHSENGMEKKPSISL